MIRNQIEWKTIHFSKLVQRVKYNIKKHKTEEYQKFGKYPIIDQGKELIVGYTNDDRYIYKNPLPVIVFGDHTRISKYIDFPFAIGADGVIILRVNQGVDPKFFYYMMCNTNIKNLGYSRHYSILKKTIFQIPPLPVQERIVYILNEQMALVAKARTAVKARLAAVKTLPAAYLRKVFPQPGKTLPEGWRWVKLGEVCERVDYGFTKSANPYIDYPKFLRITDIQDGKVNWEKVPGCEIPTTLEGDYKLLDGDIVFARTGATTGKSFLLNNPPRSVFASYLIRIRVISHEVESNFLGIFFNSSLYWEQVSSGIRGGAQGGFNASMLRKLIIPLPHIEEQRRIAKILNEQMALVEKACDAAEEELDAINALPGALLRRAFEGDI